MSEAMTVTENGLKFMDRNVFSKLKARMEEVGLYLFSEVVINHDDKPYHVPARFAQATSQFYWCEKKQLIIMLRHTENTYGQGDSPTYLSGHWEMVVYLGFLGSLDELTSLAPGQDLSKVPFFEGGIPETFTPEGLYYNGGSYSGIEKLIEANYSFSTKLDCTDVDSLTAAALAVKTATEKYLRKLPFAELWVYSFPPGYAFKGCEEDFWKRFDKRNLRALVKRPYGSTGLER